MSLHNSPFFLIKNGLKTIELRLNDEKRQAIETGDIVVFQNANDNSKKIEVKVVCLHHFASFKELYHCLPLDKCGYSHEHVSEAKPEDMNIYYSQEQQDKYEVTGIEFVVLNVEEQSISKR